MKEKQENIKVNFQVLEEKSQTSKYVENFDTLPKKRISLKQESTITKKTIEVLLEKFNSNKKFQVLSPEDEKVFLQLNFLKSSLDFNKFEKDLYVKEIVKTMRGGKILGSKLFYGIVIGVILALICIYFISKEVPLWVLIVIALSITIIISVIAYFMKNKIRKFRLKQFDEKLIKMYYYWTSKKLKLFSDDINGRRKFMENFVSKYWYLQTHEVNDYHYLQQKYLKLFFVLFDKQMITIFLSLKMFFTISMYIDNIFQVFVKNYYNDFIFPLFSIFEIKKNKTDIEDEFFEFLKELKFLFHDEAFVKNPFQICNYDKNSKLKIIFVTREFSLSNSHESFLRFNDLWFLDQSNFEKEIRNSIEEISLHNSGILQNVYLKDFNESSNERKFDKSSLLKDFQNISKRGESINNKSLPILRPIVEDIIKLSSEGEIGYTKIFENDSLKIVKRQTKESPVVLVKAEAILNIKPALLFELIYNLEWRMRWDKVLSGFRIIEKKNEFTDIIFSVYKSPMGVANREFLQKRYLYKNRKGFDFIIAFENAVHSGCPVGAGNIRAETVRSGYLIRSFENGKSHLSMISQTDIKGFIPNWIVNYASSKAPSAWMKKLNIGIELIKKEKEDFAIQI